MKNLKTKLTALLLLSLMLASALLLSACGGSEGFSFLREDMSKYISIAPEDYRGVTLTADGVAEIQDADVRKYILSAVATYYTNQNKTEVKTDGVIKEGDTVAIWYRGQVNMPKADGTENWVDFIGGSNLFSSASHGLVIGSGNFIPGFEDALVGCEISNSELLVVRDSDNYIGKEGLLPIAYIRYSYEYTDANGNKKKGTMSDRVDLTREGEGYATGGRYDESALRDRLAGRYVGETIYETFTETFDITGDLVEESVKISNVKLTGIVKREATLHGNAGYFTLSFPNPYSNNTALAGKETRWYVVADTITRAKEQEMPDPAALDYATVEGALGIKYESILSLLSESEAKAAADGGTSKKQALVVEHYWEYVKKSLESQRESQLKQNAVDAIWNHIAEKMMVEKWPDGVVESYVTQLRSNATYEYSQYTETAGNVLYGTMEEYIVNTYDDKYFPNVASVEAGFRMMAEEQLKKEMAIHYLAELEGIKMSARKENSYYKEEMEKLLAYYNTLYASQLNGQSLTEADMNEQGYTKESMVSSYYYSELSEKLYELNKDKITFVLEPAQGE